ncbi:MAG TPA: hypothetical protein VKR31_00940 [Rhizomicrobium sp.]|nr:hypothetical protein [Rhizomicrobium sp.]
MRILVLALLALNCCANVRPEAGLCDVPALLPMRSVPAPVPWHITDGCWFVGITAKV